MHPLLKELAKTLLDTPDWSTFNPMEHPSKLPQMYILEIEPGDDILPLHLRVRLTGTSLDRMFGKATAGRYLHEFIHGPRGDDVMRAFIRSALDQTPIWMRQIVTFPEKAARFVEGIVVPVAPSRIYGGLMAGELTRRTAGGFECLPLSVALAMPGDVAV